MDALSAPRSKVVRTALSPAERELRSRIAYIVSRCEFVFGNLIYRMRCCGQSSCRCSRGGPKHRTPYLIRTKDRRFQQVCIPWDLEPKIKMWVETGQELRALVREASELHWEKLAASKEARKRRKDS